MKKTCLICGKEFEPIKYGGARQYCFDCVPEGLSASDRTVAKRNAAKKQGIAVLGGKCAKCGDTRWYILNFHHINKESKVDTLSNLLADSKIQDFFVEIQKCILLCSNCHQEFHFLEAHNNIAIEDYLNVDKIELKSFELFTDKNERDENGKLIYHCPECGTRVFTAGARCPSCAAKKNRVVERPDALTLAKEITSTSFCAVGRKYGVSDNAIRKWCKSYGIPSKIQELKEWYAQQQL